MIKNYFLIAFRAILKNKIYSFINIAGLALGITASIFIVLFIIDELSYDKHHKNYQRIYRLESHFSINNKDDLFAVTQVPLGPTLKDDYPMVEDYVRFFQAGTLYFKEKDKEFREDSIWFADSTLFRIFTHPMIYGNPDNALSRPNSMVITKAFARRFFGTENPLGKSLLTVDGDNYEITGVIEDLKSNSHLRFNGIISTATLAKQFGLERFNDRSSGSFWNINNYTYILLKEGANIKDLLNKSEEFYNKYMKEVGDQINGNFRLMAKPLARVHHHSSDLQADLPNGNFQYVYIFAIIALLLILIACINYMNMATAQSFNRSKEVGLRKLNGAQRPAMIRQFMSESVLFAIFAMVLSLILVYFFIPFFNDISGKNLVFSSLIQSKALLLLVALTLLVGIIAGSYPAFYLSSFNPALVIKGRMDASGGSGWLRRFLVVFQFFISICMIIGTSIFLRQLNFMRNSDLGYDKENLIIMTARDTNLLKNIESFKQELLKNPAILAVAQSSGVPNNNISIIVNRIEGDSGQMFDRAINNYFVDYDYIPAMGIKIVEGRNYDRKMSSDIQQAFIMNETAVKTYGWVDSASRKDGNYSSALGKKFHWGINPNGPPVRDGMIVGVMKDFFYKSMQNDLEPIVLVLQDNPRFMPFVNIRIQPGQDEKVLDYINTVRKQFGDKYPFEYRFMDENIREMYDGERRASRLLLAFTILTIFIATMGLLGLSSFLTQQRTKEVGIRKVQGATSGSIIGLFTWDFSRWVILANFFAFPVAWYFMDQWLQNFRFRIPISIDVFLIALVSSLLIAILTVGWKVYKASMANPVDALKYE